MTRTTQPASATENTALVTTLSAQFALIAGPEQLDPYTRQAFLDNTLARRPAGA